jgi:uncharacterized membrane protein
LSAVVVDSAIFLLSSGMVVMRFVKVFLLLCLFGFCLLFIREFGEIARKRVPELVMPSATERAALVEKLRIASSPSSDLATFKEAARQSGEVLEKEHRYKLILIWAEQIAYLLCAVAGTLVYLRFTPKRAIKESA